MSEPLDELYFKWLYRQVGSTRAKDPKKTYWSLLRHLFTTEFVWFVPNDDNRVEDGKDLRLEFRNDNHIHDIDPDWMSQGCSFLEMMVALSRRLAFQTESRPAWWFWHLMDNLELSFLTDAQYAKEKPERYIQSVLEAVIWRTYRYDGKGGLFPLQYPERDQCDVEIWYQLNAYLIERSS